MKKLLYESETSFDSFLLSEAKILMGSTFIFDGHINPAFYSDEEIAELEQEALKEGHVYDRRMVRWKQIKPHVFSVIKGKRVPQSFSIIFYLSNENIKKLCGVNQGATQNDGQGEFHETAVPDGLMLRLLYDNGVLTAVTGSVYNTFSIDHSADKLWDEAVKKFLTSIEVEFDEQ